MKYHQLLLFLIFTVWGYSLVAQQSPVSAGGDMNNPTGSISHSIGQVFYQSLSNQTGQMNEGVQHPRETISVSILEVQKNEFNISIYPNPSTGHFNLTLDKLPPGNWQYRIIDIQGKLQKEMPITTAETQIRIHHLPAATYILQIWNNSLPIESFPIIKN